MRYLKTAKLTCVAILGALMMIISACGGGGSGGSDSSTSDEVKSDATVVSRGIITGFGSVYVNEVRFRTTGTQFRIDDAKGDESDLKIGMIVTVTGSAQDKHNGIADSIVYDNELKGPVSAITPDPGDASRKTLTILGQSVLVTANTTIDDDGGLTFDSIALNDVLEVSGYVTDSGFTATHIELQDNDLEIEIKGHIDNLNPVSFTIGGFPVNYDGTTRLDDIDKLSEGLYVEVKGRLNGAGTTLIASEIEGEQEGLDGDMDEAEINGVISAYNSGDQTFMLQGQMVDASKAKFEPASLQLADGLTVEAEGRIAKGVLFAEEVKQKGRKIKIQAALSAVDSMAATVSFDFDATVITVRVHSGTSIEDDNSGDDLLLADLSAGHFVELEAYADGLGAINAVEIKRTDPNEIRLVAPLQDFDEMTSTVVLLGINFDLSAASFEDADDHSLSASEFFDALVAGVFIKIKDDDSNGVFDKAELDD